MDSDICRFDEHYAYQAYLFEKEEWPSFKHDKEDGDVIIHQPFLIMELYRLVPYVKDRMVFFHPLNMPCIKIGKVEIVGILTAILSDGAYPEYQVEDGTGTLIIIYKKDQCQLDKPKGIQNHRKHRLNSTININLCNNADDGQISEKIIRRKYRHAALTSDGVISGHSRTSKKKRLRNRKQKVSTYVHATGYFTLDFNCNDFPQNDMTVEDLSLATPKLLATSMDYINEKQYNKKLQTWINTIVAERYVSPMSPTTEHFSKIVDNHEESTTTHSLKTVDDCEESTAKHSPETVDDHDELVLVSELSE